MTAGNLGQLFGYINSGGTGSFSTSASASFTYDGTTYTVSQLHKDNSNNRLTLQFLDGTNPQRLPGHTFVLRVGSQAITFHGNDDYAGSSYHLNASGLTIANGAMPTVSLSVKTVETQIWSGALTVGMSRDGLLVGYLSGSSSFGGLTPATINFDGTSYNVYALYLQNDQVRLSLRNPSNNFPVALPSRDFVLNIASSRFTFHGANNYVQSNSRHEFTASGLTLTNNQMVTVTLSQMVPAPVLSIDNPVIDEGHGGTRPLTFTVTLDRPAVSDIGYAIDIRGAQGTVDGHDLNFFFHADRDTLLVSGTRLIRTGQSSTTHSVQVRGDRTPEPDETFVIKLRNLSPNAVFAGGGTTLEATGTIRNDDFPTLSITPGPSVTEGQAATFTLSANPAPLSELTVDLHVHHHVHHGSVTGPTDQDVTIGTDGTATFTVPTTGDDVDEADGSVEVEIVDGDDYDVGAPSSATVTVLDDDTTLTVSVADAREGGPGESTEMVFTAELGKAIPHRVLVDYNVVGGTATRGDYIPLSPTTRTLDIPAGETRATATVTVLGDDVDDDGETVTIEFRIRDYDSTTGPTFPGERGVLRVTGTISSTAANSPPEVTSLYFFKARTGNAYEPTTTEIVAGQPYGRGYSVYDRDSWYWDRDEDGIHDRDGKPVLEGAGLRSWELRITDGPGIPDGDGPRPVYARFLGDRYAPNVRERTCMEYTVTVTDWAGAVTKHSECLWVSPRKPTVVFGQRVAGGPYAWEETEARLFADRSYGGFTYGHNADERIPIASWAWSQVSGPTVTLRGANTANPTFDAPAVHRDTRLVFHLTVTDEYGQTASAHTGFTIKDRNEKPESLPGFLRSFDAECPTFRLYSYGSDPDRLDRDPDPNIDWATIDPDGDGIVSYQWRIITSSGKVLATHTTDDPRVEGFEVPRVDETTHIMSLLTVIDFKGAQGRNNLTASYRLDPEDFEGCGAAPGTPPTGNAGPDREASPGQRVTLDGRGSVNPHGASSQLTHEWEQLAGTRVALDDPSRGDPSFTAPAQAAGERLVFQLIVTDRDGETDSDTTTVAVAASAPPPEPEESTPPTADAGPDLEASAGQTVTLRGHRSVNPHGASEDLAYLWRQVSGPTVTLSGETLAEPTFTMLPTEGAALEFHLTVTDEEGESDSDTVSVTARAEPAVLPTARAGPDLTGAPGESVTLQGKGGTNPYGKWWHMDHLWTQLSGPTVTLSDVTVADPTFTVPEDAGGTRLVFRLTVTDREGRSDWDNMAVTVGASEIVLPTANAGPDLAGEPGESVTLQGKGSVNPYGRWWHMAHRWTQLSGPSVTLSDATVGDPTFTLPSDAQAGTTLEFQLTVTDEKGRSDSDTMTVTVVVVLEQGGNTPPTFDEGGSATRTLAENTAGGENVGLPITATDPDEDTLTYTLSGADANSFDINAGSGQLLTKQGVSYDYETKSTYAVTVEANDGNGGTATIVVTVSLTDVEEAAPNRAPVFDEGASATRTLAENAAGGENVGLPITAADPDEDTLTYTLSGADSGSFDIDAGSGQLTTRQGTTYDYEAKQTYSVTVTSEDPDGLSASIDVIVNLTDVEEAAPNNAPIFDEGDSATRTLPENAAGGENVGLPLTATDPDEDTLTYTLSGADANSFDIDAATGQLLTKEGVTYDYETTSTYSVTVTAEDPDGLSASIAVTVSLTDVEEAAPNRAPVFDEGDSATRTLAENAPGGENVGLPITAADLDQDTLTYTLAGADAGSFDLNAATGQLLTKQGVTYDYETKQTYSVTVTAEDPDGLSAAIAVTVNLTDVEEAAPNRAPVFDEGASATRTLAENAPGGENVGLPITATDPDDDTLTYTLSGADVNSFDINAATGQLTTRDGVAYDYETKSTYAVTVEADDGNGGTASIAVTVNLTDVEEATPVTACFTDLGSLTGAMEFSGAWDDAECRAHHRADSPARYVHFTVSEETTVTITVASESGGALFVSKDTPRNGWGTPPKATYEHRVAVRLANGKLLHADGTTVTLTLAAGETYTVEAVGDGNGGTFSLSIAPQ